MAIDVNIPSQVKNYANLAAFPATGTLKTIFIAEDTNKTYRWTGSAYVEISATAASTWGAIGGTLSNQTDLQTALNAKQDSLGFTAVPTTRTLTINGTTQDLSADRTFTISTGITIGTTAITSGTVGRVLFQGAGNVVSQSSKLFFDETNGRLGIDTGSAPSQKLVVEFPFLGSVTNRVGFLDLDSGLATVGSRSFLVMGFADPRTVGIGSITTANSGFEQALTFHSASGGTGLISNPSGSERMRIFPNGNLGINTTTDAGYKLDVNGTARVSGGVTSGVALVGTWSINSGFARFGHSSFNIGTTFGFIQENTGNCYMNGLSNFISASSNNIFETNGAERMRILGATGNVLIGTTTDVASSLLTMNSTTKGFLPPRMTTTQKNAIASPVAGLMVYDTTLNLISVYNGTIWISL